MAALALRTPSAVAASSSRSAASLEATRVTV
jgi:hypothetical protein